MKKGSRMIFFNKNSSNSHGDSQSQPKDHHGDDNDDSFNMSTSLVTDIAYSNSRSSLW